MIKKAAQADLISFTEELGYQNAPFHSDIYHILQEHFSPLKHFTGEKKIQPSTKLKDCIECNKNPQKWLKRYMWLLPRGHGKSEVIDMNYVSWLVGNYPDIHINIVTKTASLSEEILLALITRMENDEKYIEIFKLKPKNPAKWTTKELIVNRHEISKNPTVKATGLMGPQTGGRSDLIICDDIIDEENVRTPLQFEKVLTWHNKVLSPTLYPWGGEIVIGTRWHYADLYAELLKQYPHTIRKAIQPDGTALWPSYWSLEKLEEKRKEVGTIIFDCQYQNDPTSMEGSLLKSKWLHSWDEPNVDSFGVSLWKAPNFDNMRHYFGIDPSMGEADYYGIAILAHDPSRNIGYLRDVWAEHLDLPAIHKTKLPELIQLYKPLKIYMETVFWQKLLTKLPEMQGYPIVPVQTVKDKEARFIPMSSHFEAKRVLINPLLLNKGEFWTEWVQFPRGQHDDAIDAVELVVSHVIGGPKPNPSYYLGG